MKRIVPACCLALLGVGGAAAGWTAVGGDGSVYTAYADRDTIRRNGGKASMTGLYDFKRGDRTPEGKGYFSTTVLREYDCDARAVRLLSHIDFSAQMGGGDAVAMSSRPGRWEPIVRGALDEAYWVIACGRE